MPLEMASKPLLGVVFVLFMRSARDEIRANLLIKSIRRYGGALSNSPIWILTTHREGWYRNLSDVVPSALTIPQAFHTYPFGDKVFACAQAEAQANAMVDDAIQSLVFLDVNYLVVQPPMLFALGEMMDLAVRPVHIRNVGMPAGEALDPYWSTIYHAAGLEEVSGEVTSFVDGQKILPYFNTHAFAIRPSAGLCHRWCLLFEELIEDRAFQREACGDHQHRLFLFQAALSALCIKQLPPDRIRLLPGTYNYPYHLQSEIPLNRQVQSLNELVTVVYEGRHLNPNRVKDLNIHEPLHEWLSKQWAIVECALAGDIDWAQHD